MTIVGIDPGQSGGLAFLTDGAANAVAFKDVTPHDLVALLKVATINKAYLEGVNAMPRQGVVSTFKFGMNYGWWQGALTALGIPYERVYPLKWQTLMGCRTGRDKNVSKRRAQELFPRIKITHAVADALLIAEYGRRTMTKEEL
jgi:crossover junction endodeoxyribonuclease RuvC